MRKRVLLFVFFCFGYGIHAQIISTDFRKKTLSIKKDTIQIDSVSISPEKFKVFNQFNQELPDFAYQVDFAKSILILDHKTFPKITIEYYRYPEFITKIYTPFDERRIIKGVTNNGTLYSLTTNKPKSENVLFEGIETRGFITRGLTSGNNQNAVTNSALDLKINGKLSDKVSIRANIFDTNIPIQQNGYSQNLTDFDRIFIEMESDSWRVKAGDLSLQNTTSFFLPFQKQVSGLEAEVKLNDASVSASGAIVRGKFNRFNFTGVEGNQGPYKIFGANNEAVILIIENSDVVYVNGQKIERGIDKDYTINYNLGEISFNTTFPINNDMRIWVEFQYADRNYTRFITYNQGSYKGEKLEISGFFYNESDVKSQPLQQSLTASQQEVLANAGNDSDAMFSESAFLDSYSETKILYKKVIENSVEYFEYTTEELDELYTVSFTNVGSNNGEYRLDNIATNGNIYVYVGPNQGDFSPLVQLIAPTQAQFFVVQTNYQPNDKTTINTEVALSNNDANMFSNIGNEDNKALAATLNWEQVLIDRSWQLTSKMSHEYAHRNFRTLQRWEPVEFNREWNILTNNATKNYFNAALDLDNKKGDYLNYQLSYLTYDNSFRGNRQKVNGRFSWRETQFQFYGSYLANRSDIEDNYFYKAKVKVEQPWAKAWLGTKMDVETNSRKNVQTNSFVNTSHHYQDYEAYFGIGDSTKVFAKLGVNFRNNDSIRDNRFQEINQRKTIYLTSKVIDNAKTSLTVFGNYRVTKNQFSANEQTLNSRVVFRKSLWDNFINLNTTYETASGNVARQDFFYIETEPGLGFYTWIDYNNDGVKDFNEFEVALFQDQANYLRLPKPNLRFIATQRAKFKQNIIINPKQWSTKKGIQKFISKLYNQTFITAENEQERNGYSFQFNPFQFDESRLVGLNVSVRNNFYFNKDLQKHSLTYIYANSEVKQQILVGNQENRNRLHQIDYEHLLGSFWLVNVSADQTKNELQTENFANRNFEIDAISFQPKISFLYSENNRFSAFYNLSKKENQQESFELLEQQELGFEYFYKDDKNNQISANFNVLFNDFIGESNSPVAYQMLEGLQSGTNYTWNLMFNKKLNTILNLNLSYFGRKSETAKAIHSGSVQLRAIF